MQQRTIFGRHYALAVVAVIFVALLAAAGLRSTPGVLMVPWEEAFGWSRGTISFAAACGIFLFGLTGPFAAAAMQRFGIRTTVIAALGMMSLSSFASLFMTQPWQLVVTWGLVSGIGSGCICLIGAGQLEEGFKEYEIRNDQRFRSYFHHIIDAPKWAGEDLTGKKILVVGEQGLGDEFMFANILPDVQAAVGDSGKLQICVDHRLVSLFQRSFPKAEVGTYDDKTLIDMDGNKALRLVPFASKENKPDLWSPIGSALQVYRNNLADFPHKPFLMADPTRVSGFKRQLDAMGPEKKIGLCWRSMMLGAKRAKYFSPIDHWGPVLQTPGVTFINLQYGDCAAEIARAEEKFGIKIHQMEGLDLKDDIDGAAALCAALDLVLSAPTAAAATAASVGTKVWFLTAGRTWPQLGTPEYPWYADTRVLSPEKFGDWNTLMPDVADELEVFASNAVRRELA